MGIQLIGIDGPMRGKATELTVGTYKVGRGSDCDVRVSGDENASRRHAILRVRNGTAEIEDTGSKNGTWVNDKRILVGQVGDGDVLKVGDSVFRIKTVAEP